MSEVFPLTAVLLGIVMIVLLAHWIVGPMDRAVRNVGATRQFFVIDLFGLAVLLQVATVPSAWLRETTAGDEFVITLAVLCWGASALLWWFAVDALSRAGVRHNGKRLVFTLLVLPGTQICVPGAVAGNLALSFQGKLWLGALPLVVLLVGTFNLGLLLLAYAGRRVTLWVLANPEAPSGPPNR